MSNRYKVMVVISSGLFLGNASAGVMGAKETAAPSYIPFVSLEGSVTNSKGTSFNFAHSKLNSLSTPDTSGGFSNDNENPWGGRIAGGVVMPYSKSFSIVAESGWNYFDNVSNYHQGTTKSRGTGVDLLAGIDYNYNQFGLFARAGTLFQQTNYQYHQISQANVASVTHNVNMDILAKGYLLGILPEVKVGALYHINQNWDISLSYMHAFGADPTLSNNLNGSSGTMNWNLNMDTRSPTLDAGLLGLHYNFVRLT